MIMERRLHKVRDGKRAELMAEEKKGDAVESRLAGFPPQRRYRPLAGAQSANSSVWERDWEYLAAAEEAYGRLGKDAEAQKLGGHNATLVEDGRAEYFSVVLGIESGPDSACNLADLTRLAGREMQALLREVDRKDLVVALMGAEEELKTKIFSNMSQRVRTFITEEMEFLGATPPGEIEGVRRRIVKAAAQLVKQGQIAWPPSIYLAQHREPSKRVGAAYSYSWPAQV